MPILGWPNRRSAPRFSFAICSIDSRKFQQVSSNLARLFAGIPIEIVGIHDARSLAEGYNRAIQVARGEHIIFCHDDIRIISPDFAERVRRHFERFDLFGVAGTTKLVGGAWFLAGDPYDYQLVTTPNAQSGELVVVGRGRGELIIDQIQALDGLFIAVRAQVARMLTFDASTFDGFHLYDIDFTFRAFLEGFRLGVCRDLFIIHESHGSFDQEWARYKAKFEAKFAGLLPRIDDRRDSPITNCRIEARILNDPVAFAELCDPITLCSLLPR